MHRALPGPGKSRALPVVNRLRRVILLAIVGLYVGAVPWFREAGDVPGIVMGLPDWTAWALLCFCGVATLNAVAWWLTDL